MSFFILGLPRSRTAWLANFMTYDGYCCYHEGTNGCYTIEQYKAKLGGRIGDANTGLIMFNFRKHFPKDKVVIIDSSIDAAVEYGYKKYSPYASVHSSGMLECETPFFSSTKDIVVVENMAVCIDAYFKDFSWGAFRDEETYIVRKDGAELITKFNQKYIPELIK